MSPPSPVAPPIAAPVTPPADEPQAEPSDPAAAAPAEEPASGDDEHPLATTNSPWTSAEKLEADDLPSADFLPSAQVSAAPPPAATVAVDKPSGGGSRTLMTVGLAVAAIALIGAVVYFTLIDRRSSSDDPAKVNVGSEQRDYDMGGDTPPPSPEPTETAKAAPKPPPPAPRPVIIPKTIPKPTLPQPPRKRAEDIYDGL